MDKKDEGDEDEEDNEDDEDEEDDAPPLALLADVLGPDSLEGPHTAGGLGERDEAGEGGEGNDGEGEGDKSACEQLVISALKC